MKRTIKVIAMAAAIMLLANAPGMAAYWAYTNKAARVQAGTNLFARFVEVPANTRVYVVGSDGLYLKVRKTAKGTTWYILKSDVSKNRTAARSTARPAWAAKVVKMTWAKGKNLARRGKGCELYLVSTGQAVQVVRTGGTQHLVGEVARYGDLDRLRDALGGKWRWKAVPVILKAGGRYVAASMEVDPASKDVHVHLVGSRSHTTGKVSAAHQKQIDAALEWAMADDCGVEMIPDFGW